MCSTSKPHLSNASTHAWKLQSQLHTWTTFLSTLVIVSAPSQAKPGSLIRCTTPAWLWALTSLHSGHMKGSLRRNSTRDGCGCSVFSSVVAFTYALSKLSVTACPSQPLFPLAVCLSQPKLQWVPVPRSEERVLRLLSRRIYAMLLQPPPNAVQSSPQRLHGQLPVGISAHNCKVICKESIQQSRNPVQSLTQRVHRNYNEHQRSQYRPLWYSAREPMPTDSLLPTCTSAVLLSRKLATHATSCGPTRSPTSALTMQL
ncbi:unnamed protein product [Trypanosoma congolense IL3000]|uniref:WGS project CAEQ00000000 data, annotated contig 596 n=1 Tax=Trypanosoma congolense (strain IL3000) TaxID=1068625 RepID=F9WH54_TRYCI|nr:unnamed protein product [Trypanosoma congolense IL3000]